jgi:hypothetical protein
MSILLCNLVIIEFNLGHLLFDNVVIKEDNDIRLLVIGGGIMDEKELRYYHSLYEIATALNSASTTDHLFHVIVKSVDLAQWVATLGYEWAAEVSILKLQY